MICVCKDSKVNFMLLGEAGGLVGGGVIFSYWGWGGGGGGFWGGGGGGGGWGGGGRAPSSNKNPDLYIYQELMPAKIEICHQVWDS